MLPQKKVAEISKKGVILNTKNFFGDGGSIKVFDSVFRIFVTLPIFSLFASTLGYLSCELEVLVFDCYKI